MKNLKSFTLIELLVVIVIIGILSGLVVIATTSFVNSTSNAKLVAELSTMAKTLETQSSYPKGSFCLEDTAQSQDLLNTLGMTKPPRHPSYKQGDTSATTNECFLYFSDGEHYSIRVNSLGNKGILVQESRHMKTAGIKDKCEEGWIPIGNRCVMKYEAKKVNVGGVDVATSIADGRPWGSITQTDAKAKCEAIGAHLITNAEWMAIARDIETVDSNWSGGVLNRGHTDNNPSNSLPASTDNDPYSGTGNSESSGWEQKRTHTLSNGEVIWDFAGNVWEWVDRIIPTQAGIEGINATYTEIRTGINWATSTNPYISYDEVGPLGSLISSGGAGRIWKDNTITSARAFMRGGGRHDDTTAGDFALFLGSAPAYAIAHIGFRCARY